MLFEDDHYCLKCGITVSGIDNYVSHRSEGCAKKEIPEDTKNTPTEQFFSVLQLQRKSDVPVPRKTSKVIVTRSKTKAREDWTEPKVSVPCKEKKRGKPKKPSLESEKKEDVDDDDIWLSGGQERRRIEYQPTGGGKNPPSEIFSMSPMYLAELPEDKEVDEFLQDEYDDSYYEFMGIDDMQYDPPSRSDHKGGGKSGSPNPWLLQTWDSLSDAEEQERDGRGKRYAPPPTHTGGKWKPESGGKLKSFSLLELGVKCRSPVLDGKSIQDSVSDGRHPSDMHTGGKLRLHPPETYTGGKWKAPVMDLDAVDPTSGAGRKTTLVEAYLSGSYLSPSHTGGKWTPEDPLAPPMEHTRGKWVPAEPTKCLKTSGGSVQYYCSPCGRRLASKEMYKKHLMSGLHGKRFLQEGDLECDGRSSRPLTLLNKVVSRPRLIRLVKKPLRYEQAEVEVKKAIAKKRKVVKCEVCRMKVKKGRLGKHLVSYYHYRRTDLLLPSHQEQVLENIHSIIRQSPYQCAPCHFYCNTPDQFRNHWRGEHGRMKDRCTIPTNSYLWCSFCKYRCDRSKIMAEHLKSKEHRNVMTAINGSVPVIIRNPKKINCEQCGKDFPLHVNLRRHKSVYHNIVYTRPQCPICPFSGFNQKSVLMHLRMKHPEYEAPLNCNFCMVSFSSAEEAAVHRRTVVHRYNVVLTSGDEDEKTALKRLCSECEERFGSPAELISHITEKHPNKRYICARCGEQFACPQHVSLHARLHCKAAGSSKEEDSVDSTKFSCSQCSFKCEWESDFLLHQIYHLPKRSDEIWPCPTCKLEFNKMYKLRRHVVKHSSDRKFSCSECPSTFRRQHHLVQHRQYGTCGRKKDRRKFAPNDKMVCDNCGYSATTRTLLLRHMKRHEARSYKCPHCRFVAILPEHLKRHLIVHSGVRPFKCPYCKFTCNLMENLRKHIMTSKKKHVDKRIYQCWHCSFSNNYLAVFKSHIKSEHKGKERNDREINKKIKALFANTNPVPGTVTYKPRRREGQAKPEPSILNQPQPAILQRPIAPKKQEGESLEVNRTGLADSPPNVEEEEYFEEEINTVTNSHRTLKLDLTNLSNIIVLGRPKVVLPMVVQEEEVCTSSPSALMEGDSVTEGVSALEVSSSYDYDVSNVQKLCETVYLFSVEESEKFPFTTECEETVKETQQNVDDCFLEGETFSLIHAE